MHHMDDLSLLSQVVPSDAAGVGVRAHSQDARRGRGRGAATRPPLNNDLGEDDDGQQLGDSVEDTSKVVAVPSISHTVTL